MTEIGWELDDYCLVSVRFPSSDGPSVSVDSRALAGVKGSRTWGIFLRRRDLWTTLADDLVNFFSGDSN